MDECNVLSGWIGGLKAALHARFTQREVEQMVLCCGWGCVCISRCSLSTLGMGKRWLSGMGLMRKSGWYTTG